MDNLYTFEQELACGASPLCGVDEAGRGPLAGPVFAAAVILGGAVIEGLDDSKKLSPKKRGRVCAEVMEKAQAWAVASASVKEIDELNILNASMLAMRRAVEALPVRPGIILVDGTVVRGLPEEALAVTRGDGRCASIAAASVIAKVRRDEYMLRLHESYPQYGFARHKGYPTREHRQAVLTYGPCPEHRLTFTVKP